jgi:hypothetical protein
VLASDVASKGLDAAQGGLQYLRVPWAIVEAPDHERLLCNRDGEPMEAGSSNRCESVYVCVWGGGCGAVMQSA